MVRCIYRKRFYRSCSHSRLAGCSPENYDHNTSEQILQEISDKKFIKSNDLESYFSPQTDLKFDYSPLDGHPNGLIFWVR